MTAETFARAKVAEFCISEAARHGGVNNMLAVAHVIRNRVLAGWGDWYEVASGALFRRGVIYPDNRIDLRNSQVRLFLSRIDDVVSGMVEDDPVDGALYYTEPHLLQTEWFRTNILSDLEEHPKVATVGSIWFFR